MGGESRKTAAGPNKRQMEPQVASGNDMKPGSVQIKGGTSASIDEYARFSLLELAYRIVESADTRALHELHDNRRAFCLRGSTPLRLAEFVDALQRTPLAMKWVCGQQGVLDRAYDLTLDKFVSLPIRENGGFPEKSETATELKRNGTDCRYYYRAFLRHVAKHENGKTALEQIQQETRAAKSLQGLVTRHFYLSCLECRRSAKTPLRRFFWLVAGDTMCLWMPSHMNGHQCRAWLNAHIDDPCPSRSGETERVQSVINDRLAAPGLIPNAEVATPADVICTTQCLTSADLMESLSAKGLAATIADEKVQIIGQLRPAVRRLGGVALHGLILRIFQDLVDGDFDLGAVARAFGLSKPTLSRFAGARWASSSDDRDHARIPDLWKNTAQTLTGHPDFVSAAKSAGVWPRVAAVANNGSKTDES